MKLSKIDFAELNRKKRGIMVETRLSLTASGFLFP
jgi:hypothetical protein